MKDVSDKKLVTILIATQKQEKSHDVDRKDAEMNKHIRQRLYLSHAMLSRTSIAFTVRQVTTNPFFEETAVMKSGHSNHYITVFEMAAMSFIEGNMKFHRKGRFESL